MTEWRRPVSPTVHRALRGRLGYSASLPGTGDRTVEHNQCIGLPQYADDTYCERAQFRTIVERLKHHLQIGRMRLPILRRSDQAHAICYRNDLHHCAFRLVDLSAAERMMMQIMAIADRMSLIRP